MYVIYVSGEPMSLSLPQVKGLFNDNAAKMIQKVARQGGKIEIGLNSLKNEFKPKNEFIDDLGQA